MEAETDERAASHTARTQLRSRMAASIWAAPHHRGLALWCLCEGLGPPAQNCARIGRLFDMVGAGGAGGAGSGGLRMGVLAGRR